MDAPNDAATIVTPHRRLVRRAIRVGSLLLLAACVLAAYILASRPAPVLTLPESTLRVLDRVGTGRQRADRLAFLAGGRTLAVACPRYNHVVLYDVDAVAGRLTRRRELTLGGRPVALATSGDRFLALQRPVGDAHHLEPAWWDTFDAEGRPAGPRVRVGFDPDDLVLSPDGRRAYVLLSGHAEGEVGRPTPSLAVFDLSDGEQPRRVGEIPFTQPGDDPVRLALVGSDAEGQDELIVSILRTNRLVRVLVSPSGQPNIVESVPCPDGLAPGDIEPIPGTLLVADVDRSASWSVQRGPDGQFGSWSPGPDAHEWLPWRPGGDPWLFGLDAEGGALLVVRPDDPSRVLPLRGATALQRPNLRHIALHEPAEPSKGRRLLLAISDRSGGVHLLALESGPPAT